MMPRCSPPSRRPGSARITRRAACSLGLATPFLATRARAQGADDPTRVLRIAAPWDVRGLDPARGGFVFQRLSVAETLVRADADGSLRPALAAGWQVRDDGLMWRFALPAGRRFHDGSPISAEAVAVALSHARIAPGNALAIPPIAAFAADGPDLVITLTEPFAILPAYLASASALILAPASYASDGTVRQVIGSGPYRLVRLDGTQVIGTEATADAAVAIRRIQYRAVADGETRARMVEAGDAELAFNLQPAAADRLRRTGRVAVAAVAMPRSRFVALNLTLPVFADLRIRQALSLAIDRVGAARAILRNPAAAADQLLPPFLAEWRDPATPPLRFDPAAARHLLEEAGWHPGPDGIRRRDGQRLAFEIFTYAARPDLPPLTEAMQAQWRDVGIEARIRLGDSEEIPQLIASGRLEAAFVARTFAAIPDPIGTLTDDFALPNRGWATVGWQSPAMRSAIATYRAATAAEQRAAARRQMTGLLQAELPVIPHSWYDQVVAWSRRIGGVAIDPYEASYGLPSMLWATA